MANSEVNAPDLSTPTLAVVGGFGFSSTVLSFSVTDDSGIQDLEIYINGTKVAEFHYCDGVSVRWWADNYPDDGVQSTLEGPIYYVSYPSSYKG